LLVTQVHEESLTEQALKYHSPSIGGKYIGVTYFTSELLYVLKGYVEAGALDGKHESLYRGCCQLIEVKKKEGLPPWDGRLFLSLAMDQYR
jgi:hypothetical protein